MSNREEELLRIILEEHRLIEHRLATRDVTGIHKFIMELIALHGVEQASKQWNRMLEIVYISKQPVRVRREESGSDR